MSVVPLFRRLFWIDGRGIGVVHRALKSSAVFESLEPHAKTEVDCSGRNEGEVQASFGDSDHGFSCVNRKDITAGYCFLMAVTVAALIALWLL